MALVNFHANWEDQAENAAPDLASLIAMHAEFENEMEFAVVNMANKSLADLSMEHCIKCSPTFVLFRNGRRIHQIGVRNHDDLRNCITSFAGSN